MIKNAIAKVMGATSFSLNSNEPRFSVSELSANLMVRDCSLDEHINKITFLNVCESFLRSVGDATLNWFGLVEYED